MRVRVATKSGKMRGERAAEGSFCAAAWGNAPLGRVADRIPDQDEYVRV